MDVLFVGLGSIGTRHLKNLKQLAAQKGLTVQADALRSSTRALPEETAALLRAQYVSFDQLGRYDAAFITNPTHLHAHTLAELAGKVDCFFIEKPIFEKPGYDLAQLGLGPGQKAYVAAPMRWCGAFLALKKEMERLRPYSARVICSSSLSIFPPHEDGQLPIAAREALG